MGTTVSSVLSLILLVILIVIVPWTRSLDVIETISEGTNARVELHLEIKIDNPQAKMGNTRKSVGGALSEMQSPAKSIGLAIGTSSSALQPVQDFVDNWTPLLNKVKIFCDLMDDIAEVRHGHTRSKGRLLTYEIC